MGERLTLVFSLGVLLVSKGTCQEQTKVDRKIWAGVSVEKPVFEWKEETKFLPMTFAVVNDTNKTVDPNIYSSELLVNGTTLKNWGETINNGLRDKRFEALPAGDVLTFSIFFTRETVQFLKPGVYKVTWKGKDFKSTEIVFRIVMPKKEPN